MIIYFIVVFLTRVFDFEVFLGTLTHKPKSVCRAIDDAECYSPNNAILRKACFYSVCLL